jgi:precorrin-4 methylase
MDIHQIISRVDAYAKAANLSPAHVVRLATGNPRLYPRLKRRAQDLEKLSLQLDGFIALNPVDLDAGAQ